MKKTCLSALVVILLLWLFALSSSAYTIGDIDGNGRVTASDARLALRFAAQIDTLDAEQQKAADVDFNGRVTAADARLILRVAAQIDNFSEKTDTVNETITAGMTELHIKKGGSACISMELSGSLTELVVVADYDTNYIQLEWTDWYYADTGDDVIYLFLSGINETPSTKVHVYIEDHPEINIDLDIAIDSLGWYDYGGDPGVPDYGAYTGVAPWYYYLSDDSLTVNYGYDINALFYSGMTADQLVTDFLNSLSDYGFDYYEQGYDNDGDYYWNFVNTAKQIDYYFSYIYDGSGDITDIWVYYYYY